jgi:quercetin dioxygenase-like cupin family protein
MSEAVQMPEGSPSPPSRSSLPLWVAGGADRFGERRGLGINTIDFKVAGQQSSDTFVIEMTIWEKGGPARHLHHDQDEWFYVIEGEFLFEVGQERFTLKAGDSMLAPRKVPHVWACVGDGRGKMVIVFSPAGQMEAFFRETTKANAMPPLNPQVWRDYGMELVGPPLPVG